MNAQTEQLIYWKQRHDKLAEQHAKAVEALRLIDNLPFTHPEPESAANHAVKLAHGVLAEIADKETTDA